MKSIEEILEPIVNASGFFFQLGVEHELRNHVIKPGSSWNIIGREHRWIHSSTGNEGFIDLLLDTGTILLVIECKRVKNGRWVFLVPRGDSPMNRARLLWTHTDEVQSISDWSDFKVTPPSPEAMFCVVRGQGEKEVPMLERLASRLILSAEALSNQDLEIKRSLERSKARVFIPMIITNAELYTCSFDPALIDLQTGMIDETEFEPVPLVRFRKSLSSAIHQRTRPRSLQDLNIANDRTVLVMNSQHMAEGFKELGMPFTGQWPWMNI